MDGIYNYLKTNKLICKDSNNLKKNDITKSYSTSKSILLSYKPDVNKIKTNYKNNIKNNYNAYFDSNLIKLDKIYEDLLNSEDIDTFCNELFKLKNSLGSKQNTKSNIKTLLSSNKISNNFETIINPLFQSNLINRSKLSNSNNFINNKIKNYLVIDILSQGKFINPSYPSLGVIKPKLSIAYSFFPDPADRYTNLLDFFNDILSNIYNNFEGSGSDFKIPIQGLDLGKTVCNILSSKNLDKISSISEYINTIDFTMKNIMTYKEILKKKKKILFVEKYVIPYEIKNNEITEMSNEKITSYCKNYKKYLTNEKDVFDKTYNELKTDKNKLNKNDLNIAYKIMYLFCHRNIVIFYDIYWNFINKKLSKYVLSLKSSNDKIYKDLDYKNFVEYIFKLNQSLISIKKILLDRLYKIFKPNITGKDYGISYYKNGMGPISYVNENIRFTGLKIFENLIFDEFYKGSDKNYKLFVDFKEKDFYGNNLFIGVSLDNNNELNSSLGILDLDYNKSKIERNFSYKIVNLVIKIFKNCIPIELLNFIISKKIYLLNKKLSNKLKSNLKNYIIKKFKQYIKNSTEYIIEIKKGDEKKHKLLVLKSKMNYNVAYFIYRIVQTSLYDIEIKNEILNEITKIKTEYLKIIKEKLK